MKLESFSIFMAVTLAGLSACGGSNDEVKTTGTASETAAVASVVSPKDLPSPASARETPTLPVSYVDGALSVREGVALRSALAQIQGRTGIEVVVAPSIGSPLVAGKIAGAPLVDGLLQLLRDYDVLLSFRAAGTSQQTLRTLWIYPRGDAPFAERAAPLSDRERTSDTNVETTADELIRKLASSVPADRLNALGRSIDMQIELPEHALQQLAGTDPDPLARRLALVAIGRTPASNSPAARAAAQSALQDADRTVREQAKDLLEQLDTAALPEHMLPLTGIPPSMP